ncbi:uncharacterized protein LOC133711946 [Rosa rugosa]|uniref:uncharacterized protein LOC133711946 n=1 Tax=Rosa rugosa TaxID=74645 RepID=UPI002B416648|nr:uncharacterized protein LOC133711946 [Rosa rugosa]
MAEQRGNTRPVAGQEGDQSEDTQDKRRWTDEEVVQLCKSWKVVSQCPAVGTNQKKNDLWMRVKRHFDANWPQSRSTQSLQGTWKILKVELFEWHCALRQAKNWYKSSSNAVDEQDEAQKLWHNGMKKKGKTKRHLFQSFDSYAVVEGFAQFKDIPSHTSGGTSNVGSQHTHTQPIAENSLINLDMDLLNNGVDNLHPLNSVINSCLQMKARFEECIVAHVYREVNMVAKVLSKCSLDTNIGTIYMEQPPPQVINAFLDDLSEVPRSRKVCNALS